MKTRLTWFDRIMTAVTFAEANEHDAAKESLIVSNDRTEDRRKCEECDVIIANELHGAQANS